MLSEHSKIKLEVNNKENLETIEIFGNLGTWMGNERNNKNIKAFQAELH